MTLRTPAQRVSRLVCALGLAGALSACASSAPPPQQVYAPAPPPPVSYPPVQRAPVQQQAQRPVAPVQQVQRPVERPAARPSEQQVAIGGTAFPADGSQGSVPPGSRLVVRVYDAAGGDVNVRAAEGAFRVSDGLPARYKVPVPARAIQAMDLPAVAARVESPNGGVIYRNETAVLLKEGANGDIPMTLQRRVAASAVTREWTAPSVE